MRTLPTPLRNLSEDFLIDLRDQRTTKVRRGLVSLLVGIPLAITALALVFLRDDLNPTAWFPAAAIFAGALMGTVSLLYGRVKDAAAAPRPEVGRDPVYQASVVFRTALFAAETALLINAVLLIVTVVPVALVSQLGGSVVLGLFAHLGLRVARLLLGLRAQMFATAGSRAQRPLESVADRKAS